MAIGLDDINKIARKSQMRFRLAAVVLDGDKIISTGYNRPFVTHKLASKGYYSVHAEVDAIRRMDLPKNAGKHLTMCIARVKRDGSYANSKPCKHCMAEIRAAGIEDVWYTNDSGDWKHTTTGV